MRSLFIILRSASYLAMIVYLFSSDHEASWTNWCVSLVAAGWNSWDQWKKPDESKIHMRLGVILESVLILLWSIMVYDGTVLFLLLSPFMRASIHLSIKEDVALLSLFVAAIAFLDFVVFQSHLQLPLLLGTIAGIGSYSLVLGILLKQREKARRHIALNAFEREQAQLDQERIRIASQLHDVMGQHWVSIVRALDVALATKGEQSASFVRSARETALQGLQEMRSAVHDWQAGRQTPHQWMDSLRASVARFRKVTDLHVVLDIQTIEWHRLENPIAVSELLVRASLEAMSNAVRHGEANCIVIRMTSNEQQLKLIVEDDGKGMIPSSDPSGSGISSLKKQASLLRGECRLSGALGKGSIMEIKLPYLT